MAEIISMPKLGFDMQEGQIVRWVKAEGDPVNKGEVIAEIETDKATVEVEATASGVMRKHLVSEGTFVPIGDPIAIVGGADEDISALMPAESGEAAADESAAADQTPAPAPVEAATSAPAAVPAAPGRIIASPVARRMAREHGLDLSRVQGTGPGGRIVKRDVEAALTAPQTSPAAAPAFQAASRPSETIAPSKLRQAIARRMVEAKQQVPHFYVTHEYRMDALLEARKRINARLEKEGIKLSVNDFLVKAVALTLRDFPNLNASFVDGQIVRHGEINIGNAVAVENGLLTVVCRNADQKPLRQISAEVREMARQVREGKVRSEYIEGATFSISNLGMYDVEHFIAIINPPEAAILAVGSARQVPVVENGQLTVGWTMKATISVDHRVSDGAEAAQFLQKLAEYIEDPVMLGV